MNDVYLLLCLDVALIGISLITWVLAWVVAEKLPRVIPFKPFNCRPCLTFWLTLLGCGGFILAFAQLLTDYAPYRLVVLALLPLAFLIAFILFLIVKSKFTVYE